MRLVNWLILSLEGVLHVFDESFPDARPPTSLGNARCVLLVGDASHTPP